MGNIGVAVISKALESDEDDWLVTETSSFQLQTIEIFQADGIGNTESYAGPPQQASYDGGIRTGKSCTSSVNQDENGYCVGNTMMIKPDFALTKELQGEG